MRRVPVRALEHGEHRLDGSVAHYLGHVLRLRVGDEFVAFDPATGREADAVAVRIERDALTVRVGPLREGATGALRPTTWVQALPKGDKADAIVRDATELGATRIILAPTTRSVVKLDAQQVARRKARWLRIGQEAARQCGRGAAPLVEVCAGWSDALACVGDDVARFCLFERAEEPLGPGLWSALGLGAPMAFACGAEGGLEQKETDEAREAGWSVVSLGTLILRTETVAAAVLGAVRVWSALGPPPQG
ncbi:MAG: 16S rRNA (uracil(1498)-N(3))-methyltransferase [Myxococcota bacterium]|nr:16S rRNA (uracil(1498)-N(3))-methyltransferase [Myxococcota bacterium]